MTSIEDEPRPSKLKEAATPANMEAVDKLVRADKRIKVKEIAESLSVSIGTIHSIFMKIFSTERCGAAVNCGAPPDGTGTVAVPAATSIKYEQTYVYSCLPGYLPDIPGKNMIVTCTEDGTFTPTDPIICNAIVCDAPANGTNTKPVPACLETGMIYLDIYQYECMEGYSTDDELCLVCLPDGSLSLDFPPVCSADGCGTPPEGINTESPTMQNYAIGDNYQYACYPGYVLYSQYQPLTSTECLPTKEWSLQPPPACTRAEEKVSHYCRQMEGIITVILLLSRACLTLAQCTPPPPGDCYIEHAEPDVTVYQIRESAPYSCTLPGYHIEGELFSVTTAFVRCSRRGWRPVPTCIPVICGAPPDGTGTVEVPAATSIIYEQTYVYSCLPGYSPAVPGQNMIVTCTADGTFTPPDPIVCNVVSCGPIPTIPGIKDIPPGTTLSYPDTYTYECLDGYTTEDEVCTQCLADGTYSISPPTCTEVTCGQPADGTGTDVVTPMDLKWEQSYTYECLDGYTTTDPLCTVCLSDRTLSLAGNEPTCTEVMCGTPENGTGTIAVPSVSLTFEQSYTYRCKNGYITDDALCTVCLSDGTLSLAGYEPNCTEVTCETPKNGTGTVAVTPMELKWEQSYTYECLDGYTTTDPMCTVCLSDGTLSLAGNEPNCTEVMCETPKNGTGTVAVTPMELKWEQSYTYECLDGYTTTDPMCTVCLSDGTLSLAGNEPNCTEVMCETPKNGTGTVAVTPMELKWEQSYTYECLDGYTTTDPMCTVCLSDGTLSLAGNEPNCTEVMCGTPENGTGTIAVPSVSLTFEQSYTYRCKNGYITDDALCTVCLSDGTLSLAGYEPNCTEVTCETPKNGTGTVAVTPMELKWEQSYTYECLDGYTTTDPMCTVCLSDGTLSLAGNEPNCTEVMCGTPENGTGTIAVPSVSLTFEQSYTYRCKNGYITDDALCTVCLSDGTLSLAGYEPNCTEVMCETPKNGTGTVAVTPMELKWEQSYTYECLDGYTTTDPMCTVCLSDGTLSLAGNEPNCTEVICETPKNGTGTVAVTPMELKWEQTYTYECLDGYTTTDPMCTVCLSDGTLSLAGNEPNCTEVMCGTPENGTGTIAVPSVSLTFEQSYTYRCKNGYITDDALCTVCLSDGTLSLAGYEPNCTEVTCETPKNGTGTVAVTPMELKWEQSYTYECLDGYTTTDPMCTVCLSDGTLSLAGNEPNCTEVMCETPKNGTGTVAVTPMELKWEQSYTYECLDGYTTTDPMCTVCLSDGTLSLAGNQPNCTEVMCETPKNGTGTVAVTPMELKWEQSYTYECLDGYTTTDPMCTVCLSDGTLSLAGNEPNCTEVMCGTPENGTGTIAVPSVSLTFEQSYTYRCKNGYITDDALCTVCLSDGTLSLAGYEPNCTEVTCETPKNGTGTVAVTPMELKWEQSYTYECLDGYTTTDPMCTVCLSDGTLSLAGNEPNCTEVMCEAPKNGTGTVAVTPMELKWEQSYTYECLDGYTTTDPMCTVCLSDGTLSLAGNEPNCTEVICETPKNGTGTVAVTPMELKWEQTYTYECLDGYTTTDPMCTVCLSDGTLSLAGNEPNCTEVMCGTPENGTGTIAVPSVSLTFEQSYTYRCKNGYITDDALCTVCLSDGTLSLAGYEPNCTEVTCETPKNGTGTVAVTPMELKWEQSYTYECLDGYTTTDPMCTVCLSDGTLSLAGNEPNCTEVMCETPKNGTGTVAVTPMELKWEQSYTYECLDGYTTTDPMCTVCLSDGTLSLAGNEPNCTEVMCETPKNGTGTVAVTPMELKWEQSYTYECLDGYTTTDPMCTVCLSDGTLSLAGNEPNCTEVMCETPKNGTGTVPVTPMELKWEQTYTYECLDGYTTTDPMCTVCLSDGTLSLAGNEPNCTEVMCGTPENSTGTIAVPSVSLTFEQSYTYRCKNGYITDDALCTVCLSDGTLSLAGYEPNCTEVMCETPKNGTGTVAVTPMELKWEQSYTYECLDGYTTTDPMCTVCLSDGTLSLAGNEPNCTEVMCETPKNGTGTVAVTPMELKWEQSYTYECLDGYTTTDPMCTVCLSDGTLSLAGNEPNCTEVMCETPKNGTGTVAVTPMELKWEQTYTYECLDGYTTTDPMCTVCLSDGTLSLAGNEPNCTEVMCGTPENGTGTIAVPSVSLTFEQSYTYRCKNGYITDDALCTVCLSDGTLSLAGYEPNCTEVMCETPKNGTGTVAVTPMELKWEQSYTYECLDGYTTTDPMCTVCLSDGTLSLAGNEPNCTEVMCETPKNGTGTVAVTPMELKWEQSYTYECLDGYTTTDPMCTVCLSDGTLSLAGNEPNCTEVVCGTPENGTNTVDVPPIILKLGQSYTYECKDGFTTTDSLSTVCQSDGTLSLAGSEPICTIDACRAPPEGKNTLSPIIRDYAFGEYYQYECGLGYVFYDQYHENNVTECLCTKEWSLQPPPVCTRECVAYPDLLIQGIVPGTNCQKYFSYYVPFGYSPLLDICPPGELFDISLCKCGNVNDVVCAVP
ncbi:sushi, von Willebrand factor type A, EGF and pentraxin domain-containing protein 1-like [Watersipora subatra]|uniref:sushi, von Willebrand factor type A, EGF and pentraxin domain-containing protein 1-like n=1 Tax=Watersipora subatra TaxID=2589382 RepID=UPI00355B2A5F